MKKNCIHCGAELNDDLGFCKNCGTVAEPSNMFITQPPQQSYQQPLQQSYQQPYQQPPQQQYQQPPLQQYQQPPLQPYQQSPQQPYQQPPQQYMPYKYADNNLNRRKLPLFVIILLCVAALGIITSAILIISFQISRNTAIQDSSETDADILTSLEPTPEVKPEATPDSSLENDPKPTPEQPNDPANDLTAMFSAYANIIRSNYNIMTLSGAVSWLDDPALGDMFAIGDGKVVVRDITGDGIEDLIYLTLDGSYHQTLNIWTWIDGTAVKVFEQPVHTLAGGGGNFSVHLTQNGDLLVYSSTLGEGFTFGFWNVSRHITESVRSYDPQPYTFIWNQEKADMFFESYWDGTELYMINGIEVSVRDAEAFLTSWSRSLTTVLMDSSMSFYIDYDGSFIDIGLYTDPYGPWQNYIPSQESFPEQYMKWEEALSWLENYTNN